MRTLKLTLAYDGTNYVGWQRQSNGVSVQEKVEEAFLPLIGDGESRPPTVSGAIRRHPAAALGGGVPWGKWTPANAARRPFSGPPTRCEAMRRSARLDAEQRRPDPGHRPRAFLRGVMVPALLALAVVAAPRPGTLGGPVLIDEHGERRRGLGCQLGCQVGETAVLSAAGRHFGAGVTDLRYVEGSYDRRLVKEPLGTTDLTFRRGGWAPALPSPGLGVDLDPAAVERVTVRKVVLVG